MPGETVLSGAVNDKHVSEFQVMQSPAGWYVGTLYTYCGDKNCTRCNDDTPAEAPMPKGLQEPNSRETDYFRNEQEAEDSLEGFNADGEMEGMRT